MSSEVSTPEGEINTRFSPPAPELDDHRKKQVATQPSLGEVRPEPERLEVPNLSIQQPTPRPSVMGPEDLFRLGNSPVDHLQVDNTPRQMATSGPGYSIARDFENAISDGEDDAGPSPLIRARNDTMRGRRPRDFRQADRSRETSSSRSTSPANSVEAFAEPRRRQRANTVGSLPESIEWQRFRAGSHDDVRRPTLSSINVPAAITQSRTHTQRADDADRDFDLDEEPGKTYKIDFEELEEFVALSKQGLIPSDSESSANSDTKVFLDQRPDHRKQAVSNAPLNGEYFYEKPVEDAEKPHDNKAEPEIPKPTPQPVRSQKDRFTFFSSDLGQAKFANELGDFVADGSKFQELFDVGPEGGVWWLDVLNPTKAELDVLASAFKIHRLTKEDIETQEPREKVELFSQYYFVCFRSFNMNQRSEDFLDPIHLYIIVTQDGVLSFSYTPNPHAKSVRKRISKLGDFVSLGPDYICYALIDDIVDSFAPIIRHAETESENIEDQVFIARDEDFGALLRQIGDARKRVLNMMRLLGGKADVIKGFAKRCNEQFEMTPRGDIGLYLGDIQDHVITMMSNLGHVEKMLSRSHANYLAQLNVDHLLKGNNTNKALAKITVVATILVPLNLITGLFGMNVHVPGMGVEGYGWFGGIVGTIAVFITVSLLIAKRLRLI